MSNEVIKSITSESLETVDTSLNQTVLEQYNQTLATLTITAANQSQLDVEEPREKPLMIDQCKG